MKNLVIIILIFVPNMFLFAQNDAFDQANGLYDQKKFDQAIPLYESLLGENTHKEVYFNLANAYYQQRNTAKSIYYYEKALQLDPDFTAAQTNLKFAQKTRLDEFDEKTTYRSSAIWHQTIGFFDTQKWAFFAVAALWIAAVFFCLFYFSKNSNKKRLYFAVMVLSVFGSLLGLLFAYQENIYQQTERYAIVMANDVEVKADGRSIAKTIEVVNEGTKVFIEQTDGKWSKILLPDATEGWVLMSDIKEI